MSLYLLKLVQCSSVAWQLLKLSQTCTMRVFLFLRRRRRRNHGLVRCVYAAYWLQFSRHRRITVRFVSIVGVHLSVINRCSCRFVVTETMSAVTFSLLAMNARLSVVLTVRLAAFVQKRTNILFIFVCMNYKVTTRIGDNYSDVLPLKAAWRDSISNLTSFGASNLSCRRTQCRFI